MISYIQSVANKIVDEHDDLNPIHIANSLKRVELSFKPLTNNVNGLYKYISPNNQMIVINENLCGEELKMTLFHELSHYFLGHTNDTLLNCSTTRNLKEEFQADLCGTCLYLQYVKQHRSHEDVVYPKRVYELMKYLK